MQWIFTVIGTIVGMLLGNTAVGAIIGLVIDQARALKRLQQQYHSLRGELLKLSQRLGALGQGPHPAQAPERQPADTLTTESGAATAQATLSDTPASTIPPAVTAEVPLQAPSDELVGVPLPTVPVPQIPAAAHTIPTDLWNNSTPALSEKPLSPAPTASQATATAAPQPTLPSWIERCLVAAKNWLLGGNTVLRIGVVLLFTGLAFLLRYASERVTVPVEFRYMGVALAAVTLLVIGWRLREKRSAYGLMLQGTGIAVLYLTIFAALRLHPLLSPIAALLLLVVITICLAILAVAQNAVSLAVAAVLGGFAAPILTSSGSGNHVALFSYFTLLNASIFAIAWYRAWRLLNLVGFIGTFGIGLAWGLRSYHPDLLWSTEPFLLLFLLMYVGIGLLFARRKLRDASHAPQERQALLRWSVRQADYIDATMLFGPPIVGFGLQCGVIQHIEYGMAFSALVLGLFYMALARVVHGRSAVHNTGLLMEVYLTLGVVFGTLAIPLALDAHWTSAAWAVEGAGLFWLGLRQQRRGARWFALLLQAVAAVTFLNQVEMGTQNLLNGSPLGALMLGSAFLFSFFQLRRTPSEQLAHQDQLWLPPLAYVGLFFVYLIAPLSLNTNHTAMTWAIAGLVTLFAGLRISSRHFVLCAFAIQLLGAGLFLVNLQPGDGGTSVLGAGWHSLVLAMLIGGALVAGIFIAMRDPLLQVHPQLLLGLNLTLFAGLVLLNLAVLFVLPWRTASAVWAVSGLLLLWLSMQLRHRLSFYFALGLQLVGGVAFFSAFGLTWLNTPPLNDLQPLLHSGFWTPTLLSLAALVGAWRLHRANAGEHDMGLRVDLLSNLLLVWGAAWWAFSGASEVMHFVPVALRTSAVLIIAALSVALWSWLARRERWQALASLCLMLIPCAALAFVNAWHQDFHPLENLGWIGWPLVFAVHLMSLRSLAQLLPAKQLSAAHILGCWLLLGMLSMEFRYLFTLLAEQYNAWRWLGWALVPSVYLLLMTSPWRMPWPARDFALEYRFYAAAPVALSMLAWFWLANSLSSGVARPLPYLPLANPLEIGLLIVLFALQRWGNAYLAPSMISQRTLQMLLGASLFALLTMAVCRITHHALEVPFHAVALGRSMQVQAGLSLVWTLVALALMVAGSRLVRRDLWFVGATLVGIVVVKLFFIELSDSGGLERIISFIGVGVLLLVVGYFSPLPPRKITAANSETSSA